MVALMLFLLIVQGDLQGKNPVLPRTWHLPGVTVRYDRFTDTTSIGIVEELSLPFSGMANPNKSTYLLDRNPKFTTLFFNVTAITKGKDARGIPVISVELVSWTMEDVSMLAHFVAKKITRRPFLCISQTWHFIAKLHNARHQRRAQNLILRRPLSCASAAYRSYNNS